MISANFITILLILSLLLLIRYVLHIINFWKGWKNTSSLVIDSNNSQTAFVTVIVAARNEELGIRACVNSILNNEYKNFELIVVDNHSIDSTPQILHSINDARLKILYNANGFKKESLELAISKSKGGILLFTDADCIVSKDWIVNMTQPFYSSKTDFVLGSVAIYQYKTILSRFQAIDMMAMMGITAGGLKNKSIYLANGANIAFRKSSFEEIGGYPAKHIKSGDDTMLVHEAIRQNQQLVFNKSQECVVETFALPSWKDLINQRKRWASKTTSYISIKDKTIAIEVFLFIFSICINIVLTSSTGGVSLGIALIQLIAKGIVDYWFLKKLNAFFNLRDVLNQFVILFVVQFCVFLWSGISGVLGMKYKWKGRDITL